MSEAEKGAEPIRVVDRRWWARGETAPDSQPVDSARKPTIVEDLEQRLASTTAQLQSVVTEFRRSSDEFEQAKLRIRRDVAKEVERGRRTVITELLDVLDNLDRAIAAVPAATEESREAPDPADTLKRLVRGVEMVRDQFLSRLESLGVSRVPSLDQPFDASRHEAVTTTPVADPSQAGRIVAVLKEGYAIGDEVLRPASVVVGQGPDV
jgi:molecular chaperone GrpE